jgi:hypothetical protein
MFFRNVSYEVNWKYHSAIKNLPSLQEIFSIFLLIGLSPGASSTNFTCISDVSFGNFLIWNTNNFAKYCSSFLNAKPELPWQTLNKNSSQKICFKCVIFGSKIVQKLRIFPKWALWMRHLELNPWKVVATLSKTEQSLHGNIRTWLLWFDGPSHKIQAWQKLAQTRETILFRVILLPSESYKILPSLLLF